MCEVLECTDNSYAMLMGYVRGKRSDFFVAKLPASNMQQEPFLMDGYLAMFVCKCTKHNFCMGSR